METRFLPSAPFWFSRLFKSLLEETDSVKSVEKFWKEIFLQTSGFSIIGTVLLVGAIKESFWLLIAEMLLLVLPLGFWFFFLLLRTEHFRREKEKLVPDLLLSCSAFPKGTDSLTLLKFGASPHFGLLGKEFERACSEIQNGATVEKALQSMKKRCRSKVVDRMADLLVLGYESGADLSKVFREAAEDLFETQFLLQERQALLLVQKYTLLFAGGLIVPIVLGLVSGLIQRLDFSALNLMEIGLNAPQRKELLEATGIGTPLYLAEYALLAAFFVANQEGNWKKGILYSAILLPIGLLAFWIAKRA